MNVIISILHYEKTQDTLECLNSVLRSNLEGIEIRTYVLDNGSSEKLVIDSKKYSQIGLVVLRSDKNTGFTGGHNLIYEKIQDMNFDYLLLLNNDSLLSEDCLKKLIKGSKKELVGAVVPKIYFTKGKEFHKDRYKESEKGKVIWYAGGLIDWDNVQSIHRGVDEVDVGQYDESCEINFATGACLLIKKEVIKKVGLFDERYFLYYEDADLSMRIVKSSFRILYYPEAYMWHNNAGSSSSGSELHDYYLTRNRLIFGMKYSPIVVRAHLLREALKQLINGRKWQKIGVKDYFLRKYGKGSFFT